MSAQPHRIEWRIDRSTVYATYSCDAPKGADCRTWCAAGCEERCTDPDEHPVKDTGRCLTVEWMNNDEDSAEEFYDGTDQPLRSGPIVTRWSNGDETYLWEYPECDAEQPEPEPGISGQLTIAAQNAARP